MDYHQVHKMNRELSELEFRESIHVPLTEDVKTLIETDDVEMACGQQLLPKDVIDLTITNWVDRLVDADYLEEDAEEAVFDATSALINSGQIPDTPPMEAIDEQKAQWINAFESKIYDKLVELGIELTE